MVNEILLVEQLLNGNGINERCLYQHCYLLSKYYLQSGCDALQTRRLIFDWAKANKLFLDASVLNLNQVIFKAERDKRRLRDDIPVRISEQDIYEITYRFDNEKVRKVALAILCYAKASANSDDRFTLSVESFCNWVGYKHSVMYEQYLKELQKMKYIEKMKKSNKQTFSWNRNVKTKASEYKILVSIANIGKYQLHDNDIDALFAECFGNG